MWTVLYCVSMQSGLWRWWECSSLYFWMLRPTSCRRNTPQTSNLYSYEMVFAVLFCCTASYCCYYMSWKLYL